MKPPEYSISNFDNVYEYHEHYEPSRPAVKLAYTAIRHLVGSSFSVDEKTDLLLPKILEQGEPLIIAPNHTSDRLDQWRAAAAASEIEHRYDVPIAGNVRVLGKSAFYTGELVVEFGVPPRFETREDDSWIMQYARKKLDALSVRLTPKMTQALVTRFVNLMGTMPVYRPDDIQKLTDLEEGVDGRRLALAAADRLWETCIQQMLMGHPVGIFAEGTADTQDPRTILQIKPGIGHLATRLARTSDTPAHILMLGMSYAEYQDKVNRKGNLSTQPRKLRGGHVHIGELHEITPDQSVRDVQAVVASKLQTAVDHSFAASEPTFYDTEGHRRAA